MEVNVWVGFIDSSVLINEFLRLSMHLKIPEMKRVKLLE